MKEEIILEQYKEEVLIYIREKNLLDEEKAFLNFLEEKKYRQAYLVVYELENRGKIKFPADFDKIDKNFYWLFIA